MVSFLGKAKTVRIQGNSNNVSAKYGVGNKSPDLAQTQQIWRS
jgi:hypothetical protein